MGTRKVLFLGCNWDQLPYLIQIKKRGFLVIGTDKNEQAPGVKYCDKFYNISYDDINSLIKVGIKEKFNSEDKVFTASSHFAHISASEFAYYFSIKYPTKTCIEICLNKAKFYNFLKELQISFPDTYFIRTKEDLQQIANQLKSGDMFYLKSDYGKSPSYIYKFKLNKIPYKKIFWGHDTFLRKYYLLQKEFIGKHIRINVFGKRFNLFPFFEKDSLNVNKDYIKKIGLYNKLALILDKLGLNNWLVKFDVILRDSQYVILDIGLDPPARMLAQYTRLNLNFYEFYIKQYLLEEIDYPV